MVTTSPTPLRVLTATARATPVIRLSALVVALAVVKGCGDGDGPAAPPTSEPARPTTVTVSPATVELTALGATVQLTAEVRDQDARLMTGATVMWSTSDPSVASVNASGLVTSVGEGMATIRARAGSGEGTAEIRVAGPERAALEKLYEVTDGPNWVDSENWLTDAPLGEWFGVKTDARGRVVELDLAGRWDSETRTVVIHGLSGPIPPELGRLTKLTSLDLDYNLLRGPIPSELAGLEDLTELSLRRNQLTGPILPGIGNLARLETLNLYNNGLSGPIPPELGRLTNLRLMALSSNELSGPIPAELGNLLNLTYISLRRNDLSGPIPQSFLELDRLERFRFERNAGLCTPGTIDYVKWLEGIEEASGPYCNESDTGVLNLLYETAGGPDWIDSSGWLETPALDEWHGVTANALGRVQAIDLRGNGLTGGLPAGVGNLAEMTALRVGDNALSGRLPLSLAVLPLVELQYGDTALCVPPEASFGTWLDGISVHEGTGIACDPAVDRDVLVAFYQRTDGPNWQSADNWLTDAPLEEWSGIDTDAAGRVVGLDLYANNLTGPIPPELGTLDGLKRLRLARNALAGPIPPELDRLAGLERLDLSDNELTGPIPPEFGGLSSLERLDLSDNDLTGPIPPQLGDLTNLRRLDLGGNSLTGPIPPQIGEVASLRWLYLGGNELTGRVPPELGSITRLSSLDLASNNLAGALPPELGGISTLRRLSLGNNPRLSGPIPVRFTDLRLEELLAGGTGLCAPSEPGFQAWLARVHRRRIGSCEGGDESMAYLTQAVQSRDHPVPLVAGEKALLRVFVTATDPPTRGIPPVRARFYLNGTERLVTDIPAQTTAIPTAVVEHSLSASANAEVPAEVIQPGLEMVIEIDPGGRLDPGLAVAERIPETGRMAIEVHEMPAFDLTVIPFLWNTDPNRAIVATAEAMEADPEGHELLWATRALLPIGDLRVTAHEPVFSSSNRALDLLHETEAIMALEGGGGHYMGMMAAPVAGGVSGVANRPGRTSFSLPFALTMAHELGHNMNLRHAPCGDPAQLDLSFPYTDGSTGVVGYDSRSGRLVRPEYRDLMSYCEPEWVSDYHFTNALRFRLVDERSQLIAIRAAQEAASLLLWGGTDADGTPFLHPAFVVDAPPALPDATGEHRITGRTADGDELFSLDFAMPEVADGDGSSSFAFILPAEPAWAGNLAGITLSGPGGSATLDSDTDLSTTILLDPSTGEVRAILRDLPEADAAALAPQAGTESLDVLFSRGIPDAAAWSR
ncbi:MAG: Ig-like domain-containing protein [Gammaproteobacteria bacterium]|nr:Ig-like domain-containing protein [Gammaproteobacteria bacterium]